MTVPSIIARLEAPGTPFRIVGGAGALSSVKDRPPACPAVYVYEADENSGPNIRSTGKLLQRTAATIAVVIITENLSGTDDFAAAEDIGELKRWVRKSLVGFTPEGAVERLTHASGQLQSATANTIWFEDQFNTAYHLTEQI